MTQPDTLTRRIFRYVLKVIMAAAAIVFFFDNRLRGNSGLLLLGSIAVLFICGFFLWLLDHRDDTGFWPKKPD